MDLDQTFREVASNDDVFECDLVNDLVQTERAYVRDLELLLDLQNAMRETGVLDKRSFSAMFSNFHSLIDSQRQFLRCVEHMNLQPKAEQKWAQVFLRHKNQFELYIPYVTNLRRAEQIAVNESSKIRAMNLAFEPSPLQKFPEHLISYLRKPSERLLRYMSLLKALRVGRGMDVEMRENYAAVICALSEIQEKIDKKVHQNSLVEALNRLRTGIKDWKGLQLEVLGDLLIHSKCTVETEWENRQKEPRQFEAYLFEHILLLVKDVSKIPMGRNLVFTKENELSDRGSLCMEIRGRIFVKDIICVNEKAESGTYNCQVSWRKNRDIENFVLAVESAEELRRLVHHVDDQRQWVQKRLEADPYGLANIPEITSPKRYGWILGTDRDNGGSASGARNLEKGPLWTGNDKLRDGETQRESELVSMEAKLISIEKPKLKGHRRSNASPSLAKLDRMPSEYRESIMKKPPTRANVPIDQDYLSLESSPPSTAWDDGGTEIPSTYGEGSVRDLRPAVNTATDRRTRASVPSISEITGRSFADSAYESLATPGSGSMMSSWVGGSRKDKQIRMAPLSEIHTTELNSPSDLDGDSAYAGSDESMTTYSDASSMSNWPKDSYITDFAEQIYKSIQLKQPDDRSMQQATAKLPDLLKAFAERIGYQAPSQEHRDVMFFVHKHRSEIAKALQEKDTDQEKSHKSSGNMTVEEKMIKWESGFDLCEGDPGVEEAMDDIPSALEDNRREFLGNVYRRELEEDDKDQKELEKTIDDKKEDEKEDKEEEDEEATEDIFVTKLGSYIRLIAEAPAFEWLLGMLQREIYLTSDGPNSMEAIRKDILSVLQSSQRVSRKRSAEAHRVIFSIQWDPLRFVKEQKYKEKPDEALEKAITLTGSAVDAQALTCAQYLLQTWPSTGEKTMQSVKDVVATERECRGTYLYLDGTTTTTYMDGSMLIVDACGTRDSIVELAEQFAWLSTALRASPRAGEISFATPTVTLPKNLSNAGLEKRNQSAICIKIDFSTKPITDSQNLKPLEGACWHHLFGNPVIANGFPTLARTQKERGLEIPLEIMSSLAETQYATTFNDTLVLKGASCMFVPTRKTESSVTWHFLHNSDGARIPYNCFKERCPGYRGTSEVNLEVLSTTNMRNFVGWASIITRHFGTKERQYEDIDWAGARRCSAGCVLDKVSISVSKYISIGASFAKGTKDQPIFLEMTAYSLQVNHAREMFFVLYDTESHRGWLVDGASALLHIVRTQVARSPYGDDPSLFNISKFRHPCPDGGPEAAKRTLLDRINQDLPILEETESMSREILMTSDAPPGEMKKKTKVWSFKDLVSQTWNVLEKIHDEQVKQLTAPTMEVALPLKKKLEGFEFMDIVHPKQYLRPRFVDLKSNGTAWLDFIRHVEAVTLFGKGFGDLYQPDSTANNLCTIWKNVPKGQEYLVTPISLLREIKEQRRREGDENTGPSEIAKGFNWSASKHVFTACETDCMQCPQNELQRVQKLGPRPRSGLISSAADVFEKVQGAVLIGKQDKFDLRRTNSNTAGETLSNAARSDNSFHDSAIGSNLAGSVGLSSEGQTPSRTTSAPASVGIDEALQTQSTPTLEGSNNGSPSGTVGPQPQQLQQRQTLEGHNRSSCGSLRSSSGREGGLRRRIAERLGKQKAKWRETWHI